MFDHTPAAPLARLVRRSCIPITAVSLQRTLTKHDDTAVVDAQAEGHLLLLRIVAQVVHVQDHLTGGLFRGTAAIDGRALLVSHVCCRMRRKTKCALVSPACVRSHTLAAAQE